MDALKAGLEAIFTPSPAVFAIGLAIILLVPVLLHLFLSRATPYTSLPTILLVGPSGAGKTALLTLLERAPLAQPASTASAEKTSGGTSAALTHTSQTPSAVELAVSEDRRSSFRDDLDASGSTARKFLLVDTPGHGKLRHHAFSRLSSASSSKPPSSSSSPGKRPSSSPGKLRGIVFVVDAATLSDADGLAPTAEFLYDVLLTLQRRAGSGGSSRPPPAIPVLVAANKQDLFTALPVALVRSRLEAELGRIRRTRSRGLLDSGVGVDGSPEGSSPDGAAPDEADGWLGEYGSETFSFSQMREFDIDVDVVAGNVVGDGPGPDKWWSWIAQRI